MTNDPTPAAAATTPYKGLQPFTEGDRKYFFGRERDTERIASNLYVVPLTMLYGTSGVGKSSVLQAGVMPRLRAEPRVAVVYFNRWQGENFAAALKQQVWQEAAAAARVGAGGGPSAGEALALVGRALGKKRAPEPGSLTFDELLLGCARGLDLRLLVIFDQFEEYFLYHPPTPGPGGFDAEFARAVNEEGGVNFMLSMREEELSKLDRFRHRIPSLMSNLLRLENLDRRSARRAIVRPLKVYKREHPGAGKWIEPGLVRAILRQVNPEGLAEAGAQQHAGPSAGLALGGGARIETPFLQLVLTRLWKEEERAGSDRLRLTTLEALGGAANIARTHLDEVMARLDADEREAAASVLRFLVTPSGTKIAQTPSSLPAWADLEPSRVDGALRALSSGQDMRILRRVTVPGQEDRYELFHDVLGPAILDWRARHVADRRAAEAQAEADRQLREAQAESERRLEDERNRRLRENARRLRWALVAAIAMLLAMAGVTAFAFQQQSIANQALEKARQANEELEKEKNKVQSEKDAVEEQRRLAEGQRLLAEEQRGIAEEQRKLADEEKRKADEQREIAQEQRRIAEEQRGIAERATAAAQYAAETEQKVVLGLSEFSAGHHEDAQRLLTEAGERYRRTGNVSGQAFTLANLGEVSADLGRIPSSTLLEKLFGADDGGGGINLTGEEAQQYLQLLLGDAALGGNSNEKQRKKQREDADRAREEARNSYVRALQLTTGSSNDRNELKNRALYLNRLGDLYLFAILRAQLDEAEASADQDKEPAGGGEDPLQEALAYYTQAGDIYHRIREPGEEGKVFKTAATLLSYTLEDEKGDAAATRANVEKLIAFYKKSSEAYGRDGDSAKEAAVNIQIAEAYEEFKGFYPEWRQSALQHLERARGLYELSGAPNLEAPVAVSMARLYSETDEEKALAFYDKAFKSYVRAEARAVGEGEGQNFSTEEEGIVRAVSELLNDSEEEKRKADAYFPTLVALIAGDAARQAGLLETISRSYSNYNLPQGKEDRARTIRYYEMAAEALGRAGRPYEQAQALFRIGSQHDTWKNGPEAVRAYDRAVQTYRAIDPTAVGEGPDKAPLRVRLLSSLLTAAGVFAEQNERAKSIEVYGEVLDYALQMDQKEYAVSASKWLVENYLKLKDPGGAEAALQKALDAFRRKGNLAGEADALKQAGDVYAASADYAERAFDYYGRARAAHQRAGSLDGIMAALKSAGRLYETRGGTARAASYLTAEAERARAAGESHSEAAALETLGDLYRAASERQRAIEAYEKARAPYDKLTNKYPLSRVLTAIGKVYEEMGNAAKAREYSEMASAVMRNQI